MKITPYTFNDNYSNLKILVLSDIHYYKKSNQKYFNIILNHLNYNNYDAIYLVGDIYDNPKYLNKENKEIIKNFLQTLSQKTRCYLVFGNHDLFLNYNDGSSSLAKSFSDELHKIPNLYMDNNKTYELDKKHTVTLINPDLIPINKKNYQFLTKIPSNKINTLLCHEPEYILKLKEENLLTNFDLCICGHNHNGLTQLRILPLEKILDLLGYPHKGIIAPSKSFKLKDTKYLRGNYPINNKTIMYLNPAFTSLSKSSKLNMFNFLFYKGASFIEYKKNKK